MTDPLAEVAGGPAAAGWIAEDGCESAGPTETAFPWASVTKILTSLAVWVAVEEGTVAWDDPVGPPGATLAHLLAHASGLAPDSDAVLAAPGRRRIYSNRGFELAAAHLATRAGMDFDKYLTAGVIEPMGLVSTKLAGSAASGASGPLTDLLAIGRELMVPTLVASETHALVSSVSYPGLAGVLPGFGHQEHNDWGLGLEVRDSKDPHWTGTLNSPRTVGHFGQAGSFLWVDPDHRLALAYLSGRRFGPWATVAWPELSDQVILAHTSAT